MPQSSKRSIIVRDSNGNNNTETWHIWDDGSITQPDRLLTFRLANTWDNVKPGSYFYFAKMSDTWFRMRITAHAGKFTGTIQKYNGDLHGTLKIQSSNKYDNLAVSLMMFILRAVIPSLKCLIRVLLRSTSRIGPTPLFLTL